MFFRKKVYPILPTTESDTMTFIQKLDYLEYKLAQLNEKVVAAESAISDLETSVEGKSTVTATADGSTLQTLTVDGVTYNVPQGGGGSSDVTEGTGYLTDGVTQIAFKWTLVYDKIFITIPEGLSTLSSTSVNIVFNGLFAVRAFTSYCDVSYYTIAQGSIAYVHVGTLVMSLMSEGINSGTFRYTNNQAVNITGSSTALYSVTKDDYNNLKGKTLCFDFPRV